MALNASRLSNAIKATLENAIRANVMGGDPAPYAKLTAFCNSVADSISAAVITEITSNAELYNAKTAAGQSTGSAQTSPSMPYPTAGPLSIPQIDVVGGGVK